MIWSICEDLDVDYSEAVVLYQSEEFKGRYPEENNHFNNVVFTDAVPGGEKASLQKMREEMLSRDDLIAAVFIGGMEGVEDEHELFRKFHPDAKVLPVPSPGGAALKLAKDYGYFDEADLSDVDFAQLFHSHLTLEGKVQRAPKPRGGM